MKKLKGTLFGALVALMGFGACGNTAELRSGETHFLESCDTGCAAGYECLCGVCTLSCDDDQVCEGELDAATCQASNSACGSEASVCDVACSDDDDCAEMGEGFQCQSGQCRDADYEPPDPPDPTDEIECPEDCSLVRGFPEDTADGCVDIRATVEGADSPGVPVACTCDDPVRSEDAQCYRRTSDETLWLLPIQEFTEPDAFEECSDAERARMTTSCDFAHCPPELRPETTCGLEETCELLDCGAGELAADGCRRPSCEDASDCEGGARCGTFEIGVSRVLGPPNELGGCTYGGGAAFDLELQCDPEEELREICDGTSEARLFINSDGGFVESSYAFTNPYGHGFLVVTGRCEYWAGPSAEGRLSHGVIEDAAELEELISWQSLREWSAFDDVESCPDAGTSGIYAPGAYVGCSCGCDAGAPEGLTEALSGGLELIDEYAAADGGVIEAVHVVSFEFGEDNPPPAQDVLDWPLETPIENFLAQDPFALEAESGQRVTAGDDVELLRALALENYLANGRHVVVVTEALTCSSCSVYGVLIRDELPEDVARSLVWLREAR